MVMKKTLLIVFTALSIVGQSFAKTSEIPPFLPKYYSPAFQIDGNDLDHLRHSTSSNGEQWIYSVEDQSLVLTIELIKCDSPSGKAMFNNILGYINKEIGDNSGQFLEVTQTEILSEILEKDAKRSIFVYSLPNSIQIWTFSTKLGSAYNIQDKFNSIKHMVGMQRYAEALAEGNVSMGSWGAEIHEFSSTLLQSGNRKEALFVLKNLLTTSPQNYQAHLDFFMNSDEPVAARTSAKIVLENAEDFELIKKAAKFLGKNTSGFESIPILEKNETGLQLILIPLSPCTPTFLEEAADVYKNMTGIPVKIRRLKEKWSWAAPDRIPYQRRAQEILVGLKKEKIDFTNWTKDNYITSIQSSVANESALTKYYAKDMVSKIEKESGQYLVDPYLHFFCNRLKAYRSNDNRTMYVGITEANIYSGDNNYLFSQGLIKGESLASILSYHMMLASTLHEEYESRPRLTERMAKELVPASLKQLGIPRSTDPRCPYSYSSGIPRLDEKTLKLSETLKSELNFFNIKPKDSGDRK